MICLPWTKIVYVLMLQILEKWILKKKAENRYSMMINHSKLSLNSRNIKIGAKFLRRKSNILKARSMVQFHISSSIFSMILLLKIPNLWWPIRTSNRWTIWRNSWSLRMKEQIDWRLRIRKCLKCWIIPCNKSVVGTIMQVWYLSKVPRLRARRLNHCLRS